MSRPLRIEYPGAWYHVMNRGRRREENFFAEDYEIFIDFWVKSLFLTPREIFLHIKKSIDTISLACPEFKLLWKILTTP